MTEWAWVSSKLSFPRSYINCSKNSLQSNSWHIKPQLSAHIFTYFIKLPLGCFWSSKTAKGKKVSDTFFVFLRCENVVFKRCFSSMAHMTRVEEKKEVLKSENWLHCTHHNWICHKSFNVYICIWIVTGYPELVWMEDMIETALSVPGKGKGELFLSSDMG